MRQRMKAFFKREWEIGGKSVTYLRINVIFLFELKIKHFFVNFDFGFALWHINIYFRYEYQPVEMFKSSTIASLSFQSSECGQTTKNS